MLQDDEQIPAHVCAFLTYRTWAWFFPNQRDIPIPNRESNQVEDYADTLFWKHFRNEPRDRDVLHRQWIASEYWESPASYQHDTINVKSDVVLIVVAGSDTTRVTITSIFYNLVCHPHTYQKLQDEADDFMQHRRGSTAENVEKMPN